MNLAERLLIAGLLAFLVLLLGALARQRRLPPPPLRLMLLGLTLWAAITGITPPAGLPWLPALGELAIAYGLIGLVVWLVVDCPPALHWWPATARILRDLLRIGIGMVVTVLVLQNRAQLNLVGLVTTSAVLTAVLGLAAQETLKDLFAGIELQLDPPFRVGDWIGIENTSGVVESLNLMNTTLRCLDNSTMQVPNHRLVDAPLKRFSAPEPAGNRFSVALGYEIPPGQAHEVLLAVLNRHPLVLDDPAPVVWTSQFADSWITYELLAFHRNGSERNRLRLRSELLEQIWYVLQRQGWSVPFPALQLYPRAKELALVPRDTDATSEALRRSWLFSQLEQAQVQQLARRVRWIRFGPGETIVREGDQGTTLYQLVQGSVAVFKDDGTAQGREVTRLDSDEIFGEMGFCTGAPRSATVRSQGESVLLEVHRSDLLPMLEPDPSLLEQLSVIVATRRAELERLSSQDAAQRRDTILQRMQVLFGFSSGDSL